MDYEQQALSNLDDAGKMMDRGRSKAATLLVLAAIAKAILAVKAAIDAK